MCFNRLLIVSNLSLRNELLRLTPVISLSIFTPTTFFKEQENTLSRWSRQKIFPIPLWLYTMQAHPPSYPPHQRLLFLPHLSWTPWKHPVVQGCFTLSSTRYSNDRLLFMRPKLQFNCFETLSLWSPRAPRSNYMDFMTKCKQKKKKNKKVKLFALKVFLVSFSTVKMISKRHRLNYCDLSSSLY